jgi:hypothetical protein
LTVSDAGAVLRLEVVLLLLDKDYFSSSLSQAIAGLSVNAQQKTFFSTDAKLNSYGLLLSEK